MELLWPGWLSQWHLLRAVLVLPGSLNLLWLQRGTLLVCTDSGCLHTFLLVSSLIFFACHCLCADAQQKGFYSRSIRKLESLLDKGAGGGSLALDPDIATRLNAQQKQLLHLNRALLYLLSGARAAEQRSIACAVAFGCIVLTMPGVYAVPWLDMPVSV